MPITDTSPSGSYGNAAMPISGGNGGLPWMNGGGFNLPQYQGQGVQGNLPANFQSIQQLLSQQPQSLTNTMIPGLAQILGLQTQSLMPMLQNNQNQLVAGAQTDATQRGLTGSSIEAGAMNAARAAGQQNINQFVGQQAGQLGQAYQSASQYDVGNQNQMYQNMAQAIGQQMQSQQQMEMFRQQLQQAMDQANMLSNSQSNAGMWGGLGALGGGLAGGIGAAGGMAGFFSDRRLKENIIPVIKIGNFTVYSFNYKGNSSRHLGFMAQDIERIDPRAVSERFGYKMVDYNKVLRRVYA